MLKLLRKKGLAKRIIWVIAIVIIFSFGFFGTAYLITGDMTTKYAGNIFGRKVSIEDFNKMYRNTQIQAIRQYGNNLSQIEHLLNLEGQTWDRMILLREAKKQKIKISNDEIIGNIKNDKSFEKNGRFDNVLYNAILRSLQVRPRDYEENVRDNLKIAELYKNVTSEVTISEEEVLREYRDQNEKVQASYVLIASDTFEEEAVLEDTEVQDYFQDHDTEFLVPPSVNVQYITFDFPPSVSSDDPDVENKHEDKKDLIREKADRVFQKLLVNPDMNAVAQEFNISLKTSGFFSMEQPNMTLGWSYDLLNKIFEMDLDDINDPFETATGISIVKIKEKKESYVPEFSEAEDKVREAVKKVKSKDIARVKADQFLKLIKEEMSKTMVQDFAKSAKALGLEIHQTPEFNRGQYLPQIGISKEFEEAAFDLSDESKLSGVVEITNGYCFLYLDNYVPVDMSEYEKTKEELAQAISDEKQNSVFSDYVAQLRVDAGLVNNIAQLRDAAAQ